MLEFADAIIFGEAPKATFAIDDSEKQPVLLFVIFTL
jgi:hypothetical protein